MRSDDDEVGGSFAVVGTRDLIYSGEVGDKLHVFLWENLLKGGTNLGDDGSEHGKEKRRLFLNSSGGTVETMLSIVDLFEEVNDLTTVATGRCMSSAVPIVAAGTPGQRYATRNTRFMLHPPWDISIHPKTLGEMGSETEEMREIVRQFADTMAKYCRHTFEWWRRKISNNKPWYFDARTAIEHGIIDKVIGEGRGVSRRRKK